MTDKTSFDAIIIGGSYAGLSAAMALGRSVRQVLVIDAGNPCNRQTPRSHNFITQDGVAPHEIHTIAKSQVLKYDTVQFAEDTVVGAHNTNTGFTIETESGNTYSAKKLIFSTGIVDEMPDIEGFAECWGISIVHCPYCHGYELRNQKTAIYADIPKAMHLVPLVKNLTDDVTIILPKSSELKAEEVQTLQKNNIEILDLPIEAIEHRAGKLQGIRFANGEARSFDALYAGLPFRQHSSVPEELGCKLTEHGLIETDNFQKTSIEGIFACGDNAGMMRSVSNAVHTGNIAGAMANAELSNEQA